MATRETKLEKKPLKIIKKEVMELLEGDKETAGKIWALIT